MGTPPHEQNALASPSSPAPSRRDVLLGAAGLLTTASLPALAATPGKAEPPPVTLQPSYSNGDVALESDWVVTYAGGRLSISCTVKPKAPSDAVTYLLVAAVNPRDPHMQYCSGSTGVNAMDSAPGTSLSGFAGTQLFNPAVHGSKVKGTISGFVKTELGSRSFLLMRDFDVVEAPSSGAAVNG